MKKLAVILIAFVAVIIAIANDGESEPKVRNYHTNIQYLLKKAVIGEVKHPDTLSFKEYDFVHLAGDAYSASYTFTSKNSFGVPVRNKIYLTVILNDDSTSVKEYKEYIIK